MLREHQYVFSRVNQAADLVLTSCAVWLAHVLRNAVLAPYIMPQIFRVPSQLADYIWLLWVLPPIMVGFLAYNGYYASQRVRSFGQRFRTIFLSAFETTIAAMVISFLFSQGRTSEYIDDRIVGENVSRSVIALLPLTISALIAVKTAVIYRVLTELRRRGKNWRALLLVGSGETLRDFIRLIKSHPIWGFQLIGVLDDSGDEQQLVEQVPVLGTLDKVWQVVEGTPIDEVVFIPSRRSLEDLAPYFEGLEEMGVKTRLSLNFFQHTIARATLDSFEDVPVVTYAPTREINTALLIKYAFDRVAALVLIVILSPVFLATWLAIKLSSETANAPAFYGQKRSGLNGKPFTLWKFRSMILNAEAELDQLQALNEMQGPVFKIKDDPRITKVGRLIRKLSIDELPQLYNVLRGDMSLVGPRPPLPSEVEKYDRWQRRRLSMKPGITCLWQVMGRNRLSFDTWMKLDLEYIDNWSLFLDFKILCRTVYVVATGYGAM